jgi:DNA-nicking Smr family endonuclease
MGKNRKNKEKSTKRPPDISSSNWESEEQSREVFLEAMSKLEQTKVPDKDSHVENQGQATKSSKFYPKNRYPNQIDLHGLTLLEAQDRVRLIFESILSDLHGETSVTIITGKGRHSGPQGPVLAKSVHAYVLNSFSNNIASIEDAPANVMVGSLPIRGHFKVVLRKYQP